MTLIIYARYDGGIIIISDKKQNDETSNPGQSVRKYFLPTHHEYVISLAGDGTRIDTITTPLEIEQTKGEDIKKKIHDIVEVPRDPNLGNSDGFLLITNKSPREFYHVWTRVNKVGINHDDPIFECYGDGSSIAKYLLHNFTIRKMSLDEAVHHLIAIMNEVSQHNDSVGSLEKYGFDILIIQDDDSIKEMLIYRDVGIKNIDIKFDYDSSITLNSIERGKVPISISKPKKITEKMVGEISPRDENKILNSIEFDKSYKAKISPSKTKLDYHIPKELPLIIQTDKSVYLYNDNLIVTIIHPNPIDMSPMSLKILNKDKKQIFKKHIPIDSTKNGIYQQVIPVKGKEWDVIGAEFKVIVEHHGHSAEIVIWRSDFGTTIALDQKVYTWTDKVYITVVAPDFNKNPEIQDIIGLDSDAKITIATSKGEIQYYKLVETGKDTGIFVGEITLTGFKRAIGKINVSGLTQGSHSGPNDGLLACGNEDYLSVTLTTRYDTVSASALIRWNIGEIQWLESSYPVLGTGVVRVIDPDMNINPKINDELKIRVWSDSDVKGLEVILMETNNATGIFEGTVHFSNKMSESALFVQEGDTITAEYKDVTLPAPYSIDDKLSITATSMIGTLSPPLERITIKSFNILDDENKITDSINVKQPVKISAELINNQQKLQSFVLIAEITDTTGTTVHDAAITGSLKNRETTLLQIPWFSQTSGLFTIRLFVWESMDNPSALAGTVEQKIDVIPLLNKISIPLGTSSPGCEENHKCFIPHELHIKPKQTVLWSNDDHAAHTITSGTPADGPDGQFDSSLIMSRSSFSHFFEKKGIYPYYCMVHPWQTGSIIVED